MTSPGSFCWFTAEPGTHQQGCDIQSSVLSTTQCHTLTCLCYYSRPSVSGGDGVQDALWRPKSADAQVPYIKRHKQWPSVSVGSHCFQYAVDWIHGCETWGYEGLTACVLRNYMYFKEHFIPLKSKACSSEKTWEIQKIIREKKVGVGGWRKKKPKTVYSLIPKR